MKNSAIQLTPLISMRQRLPRAILLLGALLLQLALANSVVAQHQGALEFYGEVIDRQSNQALQGASVAVFLGNARVAQTSTSKTGRFQFFQPLKLNKDYVVRVSKPGYPSKTIEIRGFVPNDRQRDFKYGARLKLEKLTEGQAYPTARIVYNYEEDRFRYTDFKVVAPPAVEPAGSADDSKEQPAPTEVYIDPGLVDEDLLEPAEEENTPRPAPELHAGKSGGSFLTHLGDTINRLDSTGVRQGDWTYFAGDSVVGFRSEDKLLEGQYLNNQKVGNWVKYHPGGEISRKLLFVNDEFAGPYKVYYESGELMAEGTMRPESGKNTGEFRSYYETGKLQHEYSFNPEGERDGRQVVYYPNGQIAINANMKDGKLEGYTTKYQENGALYSQSKYTAGEAISEELFAEPGNFADAFFEEFLEQETSIEKMVLSTVDEVRQVELKYEALLEAKNLAIAERDQELTETKEILSLSQMENELQQAKIERQRVANMLTYIALGFALLLVLGLFFRYREKKRNEALLSQKNEVIEARNQDIMDSLRYAQRIQGAILLPPEEIGRLLGDAFVLFRPKDLVSGDFYWTTRIDNNILFSVVDCTGHGVPGAMVSMVGHHQLNRTVTEYGLTRPADILNKLNELVEEAFHHKESKAVSDGMDMALCTFNADTCVMEYAGANNPIYVIGSTRAASELGDAELLDEAADAALYQLRPTKRPIGPHESSERFTASTMQLQPGDCIYLFSDGFADQFGGETAEKRAAGGKKFKYKTFRQLLLEVHEQPMAEQQRLLNERIDAWMGELEQLDDIAVMGIRVEPR